MSFNQTLNSHCLFVCSFVNLWRRTVLSSLGRRKPHMNANAAKTQTHELSPRNGKELWLFAREMVRLLFRNAGLNTVTMHPSAWREALLIESQHFYGFDLKPLWSLWERLECSGKSFESWLNSRLLEYPFERDGLRSVKYLSNWERRVYEIRFRNGCMCWRDGDFVDGDCLVAVLAPDRTLYAAHSVKGEMHHSSFLAGGAVIAACCLNVAGGNLKSIHDKSGHYRANSHRCHFFLLEYLVYVEVLSSTSTVLFELDAFDPNACHKVNAWSYWMKLSGIGSEISIPAFVLHAKWAFAEMFRFLNAKFCFGDQFNVRNWEKYEVMEATVCTLDCFDSISKICLVYLDAAAPPSFLVNMLKCKPSVNRFLMAMRPELFFWSNESFWVMPCPDYIDVYEFIRHPKSARTRGFGLNGWFVHPSLYQSTSTMESIHDPGWHRNKILSELGFNHDVRFGSPKERLEADIGKLRDSFRQSMALDCSVGGELWKHYLATILDLNISHLVWLKEIRSKIRKHLIEEYDIHENDKVDMFFHFPTRLKTPTLHLHIRVNLVRHLLTKSRCFDLDEIINSLENGKSIADLVYSRQQTCAGFWFEDETGSEISLIGGVSAKVVPNPFAYSAVADSIF